MVVVIESQTRDPGWGIEFAMKVVISGGIIERRPSFSTELFT